MVDLSGNHGPITADDFTFRMSGTGTDANDTPSRWADAPEPAGFAVRAGAGMGGSDRVEIVWADGDMTNRWLEVTVEGNDAAGGFNENTGLAASDVFYFGNKIGDTFTGGGAGFFGTNSTDEIEVRNSQGVAIATGNVHDFNRDQFVNSTDQLIARNHQGFLIAIDIPAPAPAPPPSDASSARSAVASAMAVPSLRAQPENFQPIGRQFPAQSDPRPSVRSPHRFHDANDARSRSLARAVDAIVDGLDFNEELLDTLVARPGKLLRIG
jgi:hypothetical protein